MSKIHYFYSENIQRIKVVEIKNPGDEVILEGENEQGKSSVMNSIMIALVGKKAMPEMPIRKGQKKARIKVDIGDYFVERTITEKGDTLKLTAKETGHSVPAPQQKLNEIIGSLSFDPTQFANLSKEKQAPVIKELVGLDFKEDDDKYKTLYDKRTEINRDIKNTEAKLNAEEYRDLQNTIESRSIMEIQANIDKVNEHNRKYEDLIAEEDRCHIELETTKTSLATYLSEISELQKSLKLKEEFVEKAKQKKEALSEKIEGLKRMQDGQGTKDAEPYKKEMAAASENAKVKGRLEMKNKLDAELNELNESLNKTEEDLMTVVTAKKEKLEHAKMPIDGLTIENDIVLFNGIAFVDSSGSERIKVSMAIAMAQNPELKTIFIRDANLLGDKAMKTLTDIAKEKEYQLWIEKIASKPSGKSNAVYIEDGGVIAPKTEKEGADK